MNNKEKYGFISFDDMKQDTEKFDKYGFVPFDVKPSQDQQPQQEQSEEEEFPFEGENDLEREIERNVARGTSRVGETILGAPGDIYSFAKSLFGFEPETNLPTSGSLKKRSEEATLGYTEPKNPEEERSDEVLQDIASFMLPGSGKYNMARNIGIPVVANLVKEGLNYIGEDKIGGAAKVGTMVMLDLAMHKGKGAKAYASNLFNESEKLIPEGATLNSSKFSKSLSNLEKSLESGGSAPSKEKALKKLGEIQGKMKDGHIEVKELVDFRKTINEIKSELGGFEVQLPKHIKKKAIANLDLVKKEVIGALDEYGTKYNPEFGKLNRAANESYAAYESSDKIAHFLDKTIGNVVKSTALKSILSLGGVGGAIAFPAVAGKAIVGGLPLYAAYEGYKILHQVMKSPTLRKFYGEILKGAASGNASQVSKNAKALDKELLKDDT